MPPIISKNSSSSRRVLVILALLLFIVALILVIVSSIMPGAKKKYLTSGSSFADGYKAAREQAYLSGMPKIVVRDISGSVESVSSDSIKVKTIIFVNEKVDGVGQVRTVQIDSSTKIEQQIQKDQDAFQKEQNAYMEKMKNFDPANDKPTASPVPFELKELKIFDLKKGDMVVVTVEGDKDLTLVESVKAKSIQVVTPVTLPVPQNAPATAPVESAPKN